MLEGPVKEATKLASFAARELTGIFCIHKPAGIKSGTLRHSFLNKLSSELSSKFRPMTPRKYFQITQKASDIFHLPLQGNTLPNLDALQTKSDGKDDACSDLSSKVLEEVGGYQITVRPNYADLPSVSGPPVLPEDFRFSILQPLGLNTSGLLVAGINLSYQTIMRLRNMRWGRTFHVSGEFGITTDTNWSPEVSMEAFKSLGGKILEKSTYGHLGAKRLEGMLVSVQANYMKHMLIDEKVDIESQTAYELAVSGRFLPNAASSSDLKDPRLAEHMQRFHVYGIRVLDINLPKFTLELQCVGGQEEDIADLISGIGVRLKSNAVCKKIICVKHGPFTSDLSLLKKQWNYSDILDAIERTEKVLEETLPK